MKVHVEDYNEYKLIKEHFPHIARKITIFWDAKEFIPFMNDLFLDSRDGRRQGFPEDIAKALFLLYTLHLKNHPELTKREDIWKF